MEQKSRISGKIITACFFTIWCSGTFGMGFFLIQMIEQSPYPQYGPPLIFVLIPFGMGIFGLLVCLSVLRSSGELAPSMPSYTPETIVYSGDYRINPDFSSQERGGKVVYQIPAQCPSCGSALSNETVDWIGPLQAKCPHCDATIEAVERRF